MGIDRHSASCGGKNYWRCSGNIQYYGSLMAAFLSIILRMRMVKEGHYLFNKHQSQIYGIVNFLVTANTSGGALFIRDSDVIINRDKFQQNNAGEIVGVYLK